MYVGRFIGNWCYTAEKSPNSSVCITGLSGSGKTCRLNQIELEEVRLGATVLVFDLHRSHAEDQVFGEIRERYLPYVNRISVLRDGLALPLFTPLRDAYGREEPYVHLVNSAVQALGGTFRSASRQIGALRSAVEQVVKSPDGRYNPAEALSFFLAAQETQAADAVYGKLWTVLNCNALRPGTKKIKNGKINILDFSEGDMLTQSVLAKLTLACIWRYALYSRTMEEKPNIVLALDEFQHLSLKPDSTLCHLLREGRKFGISLLLATQTLEAFSKEAKTLLNQTATRLYFRPTLEEIRKIAKGIDQEKVTEWVKILQRLQVGESLAVGNLCIGGRDVIRPVVLK